MAFWDEQLAEVGSRVMAARLALVADLEARIPALHDAVAPDAERGEQVRISYADTLKEAWPERAAAAAATPSHEELAEAYRRRIRQVREKELWNGVSLVGPHRDDLRVELGGREVATHASRGQQRTIILALKLAETDLLGADGAPTPVVLLDDVFSELDPDRSERSLGLLLERGQVLVTMADTAPRRSPRRNDLAGRGWAPLPGASRRMSRTEEAASAVQRALLACVGPGAAEQIALAQARLAWQEVVDSAGLQQGGMSSRLITVVGGTAQVEASEPILAQELNLRGEALAFAVNQRMAGRPGATMVIGRVAVSVARSGGGRSL